MSGMSGRNAIAIRCAVALALALVFLAWLNPHLMVDLSQALWSCF